MSNEIDSLVAEGDVLRSIRTCRGSGYPNLGLLIAKILSEQYIADPSFIYELNELYQVTKGKIVRPKEPEPKPLPLPPPDIKVPIAKIEPRQKTEEKDIVTEFDVKEDDRDETIYIKLLCNWDTSDRLCKLWNKMSKGNGRWNNIKIVSTEKKVDYYVVINCPPVGFMPNPKKTIVFRMEPNMEEKENMWGDWSKPDIDKYLKVCYHEDEHNNVEWHLSKTYNELMNEEIKKDSSLDNVVSTVLSHKYTDPGHILRVDFVKYLEEEEVPVHVFGNDKFHYDNYKGSLPSHQKDNALFPYKYTFNAENHSIAGYFTEKLVDGILAECLTFYWGSYGVREFIDERAYVFLDLEDFDKSLETVKKAIEEDWWSQRIEYIRAEKKKILNELQFFPRLEKMLKEIKNA